MEGERDRVFESDEQLAGALAVLDVHFLENGTVLSVAKIPDDRELVVGLASSQEARLRLALIPLFLRHPILASVVPDVFKSLNTPARLILQFYYTAALLLQQKYARRLAALFGKPASLPDHFSRSLQISMSDRPDESLRALADRHRILSGEPINWLGTYEHAAQRFLSYLEKRRRWIT